MGKFWRTSRGLLGSELGKKPWRREAFEMGKLIRFVIGAVVVAGAMKFFWSNTGGVGAAQRTQQTLNKLDGNDEADEADDPPSGAGAPEQATKAPPTTVIDVFKERAGKQENALNKRAEEASDVAEDLAPNSEE